MDEGTLRSCRLHHWKKVVSARARADRERRLYPKSPLAQARARQLDREANLHLGFVQALNDCFPLSDNAEDDLFRENVRKGK